jgi:hypothetical protein
VQPAYLELNDKIANIRKSIGKIGRIKFNPYLIPFEG